MKRRVGLSIGTVFTVFIAAFFTLRSDRSESLNEHFPDPTSQDTTSSAPTSSRLEWIEDARVPGGVRIEEPLQSGRINFAGSHLLAKVQEQVSVVTVREWLQANAGGKVISNRNGLLKIAPAAEGLESLLQLKSLLESAQGTLFAAVERDYIHERMVQPNDPEMENPGAWYFDAIGAYEGWDLQREAQSIVVAVIDSGIVQDAPEFEGNLWRDPTDGSIGYDFIDDDNLPNDEDGHGTAVAGVIGARGDNGIGSAGIAWRVQLMSLKVINEFGYGLNSDVVAAIDQAIDKGAHIINMSIGTNGWSDLLDAAVQRAGREQIAVVCAAGNYGNDLHYFRLYPAALDYPHVVQVAASTQANRKASFTSYSKDLVDFFAPGSEVEVINVIQTAIGGMKTANGTSYAAPIVSGMLALVMEAFPAETLEQQLQRIEDGAVFHEALGRFSKRGTIVNLGRTLAGYRPKPPAIIWETNPLPAVYGEELVIQPAIVSDSAYTVEWLKDGEIMPGRESPILSFKPFLAENAANYSLRVTSLEGQTTSEPLIVEGIPSGPVITRMSPSIGLISPSTVDLWVNVSGNRPVIVDWYREGDSEPILSNSHRLSIFVESTSRFYVKARHAYGETVSDYIAVTLEEVDWLDQVQPSTVIIETPPFGSLLKTRLALNPVYWSIEAPITSGVPFESADGVYFRPSADPSRIMHIAPDGTEYLSDPVPPDFNISQVVAGFVILTDGSGAILLDPLLRPVPNAFAGRRPLVFGSFENTIYEVYLDQESGKHGFHKTEDFVHFTQLAEDLPEASDVYQVYYLLAGRDVACVFIHNPYIWSAKHGMVGRSIEPTITAHEGDLYRRIIYTEPKGTIEIFDTESGQWRFHAQSTPAELLRLGFNSNTLRERDGMRQVFDGENWISVWANLGSVAASWTPNIATDSAFYSYEYFEGIPLRRSEDGYRWEDLDYTLPDEAMVTSLGEYLVILHGTEATWINDTSMITKQLHFEGEFAPDSWPELRSINGLYFIREGAYKALWVSTDLEHWQKTNLSGFPIAIEHREDGGYRGLDDLNRWISSDDRLHWEIGSFSSGLPEDPWLYFSQGIISGYQYSVDGQVWMELPFRVDIILETRNRVLLVNRHYGIGSEQTMYFDKTTALQKPFAKWLAKPYILSTSEVAPLQPVQVDIGLSSVLPVEFERAVITVEGDLPITVDQFPLRLEIVPQSHATIPISYMIDYGEGDILSGNLYFYIPHGITPPIPPIGAQGLKINDVGALTRNAENPLIGNLQVTLANASSGDLLAGHGIELLLQWIDPVDGTVMTESLHPINLSIPQFELANVNLQVPVPDLEMDAELELAIFIRPQAGSPVLGEWSTVLTNLPIRVTADLRITVAGNGQLSLSNPGPFRIGDQVDVSADAGAGHTFAYWRQPQKLFGKNLRLTMQETSHINAVFLPHPVAAINRQAIPFHGGGDGQFYFADDEGIYLYDERWAFSHRTGWITCFEVGEGMLATWSAQSGWFLTHPDWMPFHWSISTGSWFEGIVDLNE